MGSGGYEPSLIYKPIGGFFLIRGIHPPGTHQRLLKSEVVIDVLSMLHC